MSDEKITAAELERIADSYRAHRDWDESYAPSAVGKRQVTSITSAAARLLKTVGSLNDRARRQLELRIGDQLQTDGAIALSQVTNTIAALAKAAEEARTYIPRTGSDAAARTAASALRSLFAYRNLTFSAGINADGTKSLAVETLLAVAVAAGNKDMTAEAARKWIEDASAEHRDGKKMTQEEAAADEKSIH
jgi:hypothetical protein